MSNYPTLRIPVMTGLQTLRDQVQQDPDYLKRPECPYDPEMIRILEDLFAVQVVERIVEKEVQVEVKAGRGRPTKDVQLSTEDQSKVLDEIKTQLRELNTLGVGGAAMSTSDQVQVAKTKTVLLSELLKMMERHTTVAKMEAFKEAVINILDDLIPEKDREIFVKRLEPFR